MAKKEQPIKNKKGPGRPPKPIDLNLLRDLASIHCTMDEMAKLTHLSVETLHNKYLDVIKEAREGGKMSLRRWQMAAAERGNVTMLIWLGKILLGQKETIAISSAEPEVRELLRRWGAGVTKREIIEYDEKANSSPGDVTHVQRDVS